MRPTDSEWFFRPPDPAPPWSRPATESELEFSLSRPVRSETCRALTGDVKMSYDDLDVNTSEIWLASPFVNMKATRTTLARQSAHVRMPRRSAVVLLILAGLVGAALSLAYAAVWPERASANVGFGLTPGSVTAHTCAAAEVTCTASSTLETQAGAHPTGTLSFALNSETVSPQPGGTVGTVPVGLVKDVVVQLPPGLVGNPRAVPQCSNETLKSGSGCPRDTMVGYAVIETAEISLKSPESPDGTVVTPVFNLIPAPGQAAQFGFIIAEAVADLVGSVRTDGNYGLTVASNNIANTNIYIKKVTTTFWGVPAEHNGPGALRVAGAGITSTVGGEGAGPKVPFLTNPSNCSSGPLTTRVDVDSWEDPGTLLADGEPNLADPAWHTETGSSPQPTGCEALPFGPSLKLQPVTDHIDAPSGYEVILTAPQNETIGGLGEADLDNVNVTLPPGVSVDPSAADGLEGCTDVEYGYGTNSAVSCPAASQIGEVEVETPLLAPHSLTGQIYLGSPLSDDPQSGEMFRLFLVANGPGLLIKIEGSAVADPTTGQLSATFLNNPPLPFSEFKLRFNGGDRAPLANPPWCETANTTSQLSSYGGQAVVWTDPLMFSSDGRGGACPASIPFSPSFSAGTLMPLAGAFSPFTLSFGRSDRQQTLSQISMQLPAGLLGILSSVPLCEEPQAAAGTCGAASRIGTATASAGPGPHPFYVSGPVYLTGPHGGAPFGLSVAVPAIAGPFNLGTVVVRAGIYVNPATAAVSVVSSPLPRILDGIPLRIQNINVTVDRADFTFNPTSCAAQMVSATISSSQGADRTVSSPFGVGGCQNLPFKPSFRVSTQANTSKANGAGLDVKVASRSGQANIAKVDVTLPKQLPSRLATLQKACTQVQFAANPAGCPAGSFVGVATAVTPVLNVPLTGPAILVSHGGAAFPDLVLILQGQGVTIELTGNTLIKKGVTYSKFDTVPDAPVSTFELRLPEGPHSILGTNISTKANGSMCAQALTMPTTIIAQSGAQMTQRTKIAVSGCPKPKKPAKKKKKQAAGKARKRPTVAKGGHR